MQPPAALLLVLTNHRLIPPLCLPSLSRPVVLVGHRPLHSAAHLRCACPSRTPGPAACGVSFVATAVRATVLHREYAIPTRKASSSGLLAQNATRLAVFATVRIRIQV